MAISKIVKVQKTIEEIKEEEELGIKRKPRGKIVYGNNNLYLTQAFFGKKKFQD